jgi:hypothetical protein
VTGFSAEFIAEGRGLKKCFALAVNASPPDAHNAGLTAVRYSTRDRNTILFKSISSLLSGAVLGSEIVNDYLFVSLADRGAHHFDHLAHYCVPL